jgi:peptidoglycan pentaglycine glycine transferase (the first glycine)
VEKNQRKITEECVKISFMQIVEIKSQVEMDRFMARIEHSPFQQSFEWGEFQERTGQEIIRLGVEDEGKLIGAATLIVKRLPVGYSYLYCPRGPVLDFRFSQPEADPPLAEIFDFRFEEIWNLFLGYLNDLAKSKKAIFLRFEPQFEIYSKIENRKSKIFKTLDVQPSKTLILDLSKSEKELMNEMHPKTRYNIRLAEKKGVIVREMNKSPLPPFNSKSSGLSSSLADKSATSFNKGGRGNVDDFEKFWKLMKETVERDGFRLHGKEYYRKMLSWKSLEKKILRPQSGTPPLIKEAEGNMEIKLFFAEYGGKVLALAIIVFFGDTATYVHGASSNEMRNIMAPFFLHWEIITEAKKNGFKYYDFYGIDENKWPGVTRFKKGFGGSELNFPGTFDLSFNKLSYCAYDIIRRARRAI